VSLEVQLLKTQEAELSRQQRQQREAAEAAAAEGAEQAATLSGLLASLRDLRAALTGGADNGGGDGKEPSGASSAGDGTDEASGAAQQGAWPPSAIAAASRVLAALRAVSDQRAAAAALVEARREKGVQSDDPLSAEWRAFVAALFAPGAPPPRHPLQLRACCEAVVRIYARALRGLEESVEGREAALAAVTRRPRQPQQPQPQPQQQEEEAQALPPAQQQPGQAPQPESVLPAQLPGSCLFDVLVAHYSQDGLAPAGDTEAWRDPEGPIARLLLSCRAHHAAAPSAKLGGFLRLAGAAAGDAAPAWGVGEWQFLLRVLLGVKRLVAGLWRGLLRDWCAGWLAVRFGRVDPLPHCNYLHLGLTASCLVPPFTERRLDPVSPSSRRQPAHPPSTLLAGPAPPARSCRCRRCRTCWQTSTIARTRQPCPCGCPPPSRGCPGRRQ
jgi:hypothetical protein